MKIIFLDFDGVINNAFKWQTDNPDHFDRALVQNINSVILATGAKVVVSSDWRRGSTLLWLQDILDQHGFQGTILDKTDDVDDSVSKTLQDDRVNQIQRWLDQHDVVDRWIVIDDMVLPLADANFVKTNPALGFTDADAGKAIRLLND
jgi:hypothetical protein